MDVRTSRILNTLCPQEDKPRSRICNNAESYPTWPCSRCREQGSGVHSVIIDSFTAWKRSPESSRVIQRWLLTRNSDGQDTYGWKNPSIGLCVIGRIWMPSLTTFITTLSAGNWLLGPNFTAGLPSRLFIRGRKCTGDGLTWTFLASIRSGRLKSRGPDVVNRPNLNGSRL